MFASDLDLFDCGFVTEFTLVPLAALRCGVAFCHLHFNLHPLDFHCLFVISPFGAQGRSIASGVWIVPIALNQIDSELFIPVDLDFSGLNLERVSTFLELVPSYRLPTS